MSRIGIEFPFPNPFLGLCGISSINDESLKDKAKARNSAAKESIRLIKKKFCSGDNSEVPHTLKRGELFTCTTSCTYLKES